MEAADEVLASPEEVAGAEERVVGVGVGAGVEVGPAGASEVLACSAGVAGAEIGVVGEGAETSAGEVPLVASAASRGDSWRGRSRV